MTANGDGVSFCSDERDLRLRQVAQSCDTDYKPPNGALYNGAELYRVRIIAK